MDDSNQQDSQVQPEAAPRKGRFISIRTRLLLRFTLVFTLAWGGATYWFHQFATNAATRRIERDMVDTLDATLARIDVDALQALVEEVPPGETDDPRYVALEEWLNTVVDVKPYATLNIYVHGDQPDEIRYVADASHIPDLESAFLDPEVLDLEAYPEDQYLLDAFAERKVDINNIAEDDYGSFVSASAPLINSAGESIGVLLVEYDADFVQQLRREATESLLALLSIGYVAGFALVFLTATLWTRPFSDLTQAAHAIARGEYKQDLSRFYNVRFRSEISELAEAIEESGRVHIREQVLIERVHKLEIQIDETKAAKQVDEIVESEFFQDLKAKARVLREERAAEERSAEE